MNQIIREFTRPSKDIIAKFADIPSAIISDVLGRYNCMDNRIKPVYPKARVVGPAFTVRTYPSDNLMIHLALKLAEKGDLLVVDAGGYPNAGLWGELMTVAALQKELVGIVIDGGVRDRSEIEELGFPVFCAGINARGGYKSNPGALNCAISCGGIAVNPGDIIVADENGVVAIPQDEAESTLLKAQQKMIAEAELIKKMRQGIELFELLGLDEELKRLNITW